MDKLEALIIQQCIDRIEKTHLPVLNRISIKGKMVEVDENLNTVKII